MLKIKCACGKKLKLKDLDLNKLTCPQCGTLIKLTSEEQRLIGVALYSGDGIEQNFEEAVKWILLAANNGHARAQCNMGVCYANGEGVPHDWDKAVYWYSKSAEQGYAVAQVKLGTCYLNGTGVPHSNKAACELFQKSAEQGNAWAMNSLGEFYLTGTVVEKNISRAITLFKAAAQKGNWTAQYNLGLLYYEGKLVKENYSVAVKYFKKAARTGFKDAIKWLNEHYYFNGTHQCPVCRGTGREEHWSVDSKGERVINTIRCEFCDGTGLAKSDSDEIEMKFFGDKGKRDI